MSGEKKRQDYYLHSTYKDITLEKLRVPGFVWY